MKLRNGKIIQQKILFDLYLLYYKNCKHIGRITSTCRTLSKTNSGSSFSVLVDLSLMQVIMNDKSRGEKKREEPLLHHSPKI